MRAAILHLAFEGLEAREAHSEGAVDNTGSNTVSATSATASRGPPTRASPCSVNAGASHGRTGCLVAVATSNSPGSARVATLSESRPPPDSRRSTRPALYRHFQRCSYRSGPFPSRGSSHPLSQEPARRKAVARVA
jgi:hypothetical protein